MRLLGNAIGFFAMIGWIAFLTNIIFLIKYFESQLWCICPLSRRIENRKLNFEQVSLCGWGRLKSSTGSGAVQNGRIKLGSGGRIALYQNHVFSSILIDNLGDVNIITLNCRARNTLLVPRTRSTGDYYIWGDIAQRSYDFSIVHKPISILISQDANRIGT